MLSFVIPAYNEEASLGETLGSIHAAAGALGLDYEIVVANDASTDATAQVARAAGARVVDVSFRQISRTRNAGARAARGDRLVFVDADTLVNAPVVRAALDALDAGAVGGGARVHFHGDAPRWAHFSIAQVIWWMGLLRWAAGCFVFARRDAFEAVGGFDERHFAAEEIMLSKALKRRGRFVILQESVSTSPRKCRHWTFWQMLRMTSRLLVQGWGAARKRENTQFWYDGRR